MIFEFWKKKDGKILKHFRKAIKLARLFKSPAVVANFQIFSITISRSSIIHTLYNWSLIVTSLDLLTIRFRSLKLKLCNRDNLNHIRIRLSIHRFFLSSRVNYNIFLFYPNACLFEWFLVRWQKKKNPKVAKVSQIFVRIRIKGTVMINWLKLLDFLHREEKNFSNFQFLLPVRKSAIHFQYSKIKPKLRKVSEAGTFPIIRVFILKTESS